MKKILLITSLLYCTASVYSQRNLSNDEVSIIQDDRIEIPKRYRAIYLGFGPRFLNTDPGTIVTSFTDDSPTMDMLETLTDVKDDYLDPGFQLAYRFGKYEGLSHAITIDVNLGEHYGALFTYGLGYNFTQFVGDRLMTIRPSVYVGFGNYGFNVGQLINNAAFIQIGETQYTDPSLDVLLKSQVFVIGPSVDLQYNITDRFDIYINASYDIASNNSRPKLEFTPTNGRGTTSTLSIDSDNPNVTYNGEKLTSLPYDISGIRLTAGIAYVWKRTD